MYPELHPLTQLTFFTAVMKNGIFYSSWKWNFSHFSSSEPRRNHFLIALLSSSKVSLSRNSGSVQNNADQHLWKITHCAFMGVMCGIIYLPDLITLWLLCQRITHEEFIIFEQSNKVSALFPLIVASCFLIKLPARKARKYISQKGHKLYLRILYLMLFCEQPGDKSGI